MFVISLKKRRKKKVFSCYVPEATGEGWGMAFSVCILFSLTEKYCVQNPHASALSEITLFNFCFFLSMFLCFLKRACHGGEGYTESWKNCEAVGMGEGLSLRPRVLSFSVWCFVRLHVNAVSFLFFFSSYHFCFLLIKQVNC